MALRVLAHFVPGEKVLDFVAPERDWLDIHWCAEDDDTTFHRELPDADVIWHVLRPLSGDHLARGTRLRLVHKLGAGVNTIDVAAATRLGIAVANMPGANAPSVAEGTVSLMLAALRRLPALALRAGRLAAAGLDVFETEPVEPGNPLLSLDNVVLSPHVAWYTADTMRRYLVEALDNCRRLRDGVPLTNVVNQPAGC